MNGRKIVPSMTDFCKHGFDMAQTCRKCGRIKRVEAPNFEALKIGFTTSIDRLEEAVRKMQVELAKGPIQVPEPADDSNNGTSPDADSEPPPPRGPYPWERR